MSPIEPTGGATTLRNPAKPAPPVHARSGRDKANAIQAHMNAAAAAPVETQTAVTQVQNTGKTRLLPLPPGGVQASLAKPITAVILHELRLQQELADVQQEKESTV